MGIRNRAGLLLALLVTGLSLAATAAARTNDTTLGLVGYAVPREALGAIIKEWQKTPQGQGVDFTQSYGASGDQARAVANGLKADIVQLSTGLDVDYLDKQGHVDAKWEKQGYNGIVTHSLGVFAVRPGKPKKIKIAVFAEGDWNWPLLRDLSAAVFDAMASGR